jgi:hypothetical protein
VEAEFQAMDRRVKPGDDDSGQGRARNYSGFSELCADADRVGANSKINQIVSYHIAVM